MTSLADYVALKHVLSDILALSEDALHVYAALLLQLFFALMSRKPVSSVLPWLGVLLVELINEWVDIQVAGGWHTLPEYALKESIGDLRKTMIAPTLLLLATRFAPDAFVSTDRETRARNPSDKTTSYDRE